MKSIRFCHLPRVDIDSVVAVVVDGDDNDDDVSAPRVYSMVRVGKDLPRIFLVESSVRHLCNQTPIPCVLVASPGFKPKGRVCM